MQVNDIALIVGSLAGVSSGVGALWLGLKKHQTDQRFNENEGRVEDVVQRVSEWSAINARNEADNLRLRADNDALRTDNDNLRIELHSARIELAALRKG